MEEETLRVEIDGAEVDGLADDLELLEVELDDELAGMVRMTLVLDQDGAWPYLDDERFTVWRSVTVTAGVGGDTRRLLSGYLTHVRPSFGAGADQCRVEVWGMDASVLMDRVDRLKDWPNKRDSDIATELFTGYGLVPEVTGTDVVHDEQVSTIIQRETDIQLLRRLALRNGFECFVDGDTGYFRPPVVDGPPQPVLAVHFGDETNVNRFSLEVNALAPADVTMVQTDRVNGDLLEVRSEPGKQAALGARPASSYLPPSAEGGRIHIGQTIATGSAEMAALCQGLHDRGEWFVTGEGEVSANEYGGILMPRGTVTIKGIGETHSGVYQVCHVTHRFSRDGYVQDFRVKRNALMPTGDENFASGGDGLLGALGGL